MFEHVEAPTFIDITLIHIAAYLLIPVLLGDNRQRALISATFTYALINLAHLPFIYFFLFLFHPFIGSLTWPEFLQQNTHIYYSLTVFSNTLIVVCCIFAAQWLRETRLKPPIKMYIFFNLFFALFPKAVLALYEEILAVLSIPFFIPAIVGAFIVGLMLFLFYLYTRLAADNIAPSVNIVKPADITSTDDNNYTQFIQVLSRRELELVEALLAGNYSYKELSSALNVTGNTVKAHLKNIYRKTGVSSINALTALFRRYKTTPFP